MKQVFKATSLLLSSIIIVLVSIVPQTAHSLEEGMRDNEYSGQSSKNTEIRSKLCERYNSTRFSNTLSAKDTKVQDKFAVRRTNLETERREADEKRAELQSVADSKRQEHYVKLLENTSTAAQVIAVESFKLEVESAVEERRVALDIARENYRSGTDTAISAQRNAYDAAVATLKLATDSAISTAKTSCESGVSSSEVSATLKAELRVAKETFKQSTEAITPIGDVLSTLREARRTEYEQAKSIFNERLSSARRALTAEFSDDVPED